MNEIWKEIGGKQRIYEVSNFGKICSRSRKTNKLHNLSPTLTSDGYLRIGINLTGIGKSQNYYIHRLVAMAFLPNPNNLPEVNHIDCNTVNNSVENLEWCTHADNIRHSERVGNRMKCHKLTFEDICFIRKNCVKRDKNFSQKALAKRFNVNPSTIHKVMNQKYYLEELLND